MTKLIFDLDGVIITYAKNFAETYSEEFEVDVGTSDVVGEVHSGAGTYRQAETGVKSAGPQPRCLQSARIAVEGLRPRSRSARATGSCANSGEAGWEWCTWPSTTR